jgi:dienelactone hydrolase
MRTILHLLILLLSMPALTLAQQPSAQTLPPAPPLLSPKICGKGVFLLSLGEQSLGRETFEIQCKPDATGYRASGNTALKLPNGPVNLDTTIEVDKAGAPLSFNMKGEVAGARTGQSFVFMGNKATITVDGKTDEMAYTNRAAMLPNLVTYVMQFIAARYDNVRGGEQEITIFPNIPARMERTGRDEVSPAKMIIAGNAVAFDRYSLKIGPSNLVLWTDMQGRLAVASVPAQGFVAAREEYASFVEPLRNALLAKVKGIVPDYSAPAGAPFTAEEVKVQAKGFMLAGTLLLPKTGKRPFPAVVMVTGSGQQTRDEPALPGVEKYRPFRQIAEFLASRGIAVLRVDDRGVGESGGFDTLDKATTFDFADDVRAQITYLRTRSEIDASRIGIIGHSEGGVIAPLVAASDPKLAAIVLMAGTAKRGEDVLRFQFNYEAEHNPGLSEEERAKARAETENFIRAIKENGDVSKYPVILRGLNSPWGRAFLAYDPLTTIVKVRQPILILQGALDQQVTADQARMLEEAARKSGNKDVTIRVFPNLNHLFLPAKTGAESEYSKLETYSLSDEVLNAIADWLQVKLKVGK